MTQNGSGDAGIQQREEFVVSEGFWSRVTGPARLSSGGQRRAQWRAIRSSSEDSHWHWRRAGLPVTQNGSGDAGIQQREEFVVSEGF
ncbi:hypothetical protein, partial [Arthrobacter sp. PsM3]|uniref:hypothetical protein n=1 Tax=Arthrobacter sp. PsM3 TaxID=3030531 RepID=UPI00263B3801